MTADEIKWRKRFFESEVEGCLVRAEKAVEELRSHLNVVEGRINTWRETRGAPPFGAIRQLESLAGNLDGYLADAVRTHHLGINQEKFVQRGLAANNQAKLEHDKMEDNP